MVCIIDDREDVWKFAPNLITVKKYVYFQGTGDINAPPGSREPLARKKGGRLPSGPRGSMSVCFTVSPALDAGFTLLLFFCMSVLQGLLCLCCTEKHDVIWFQFEFLNSSNLKIFQLSRIK